MFNGSITKVVFAALSLMAPDNLVSAGASSQDRQDYPEVYAAFKDWGRNFYWKSYDTRADDGHDLTMFRIIGRTKRKQHKKQWTKGVIMLLNGFTKDSYTWFDHRRGDMNKPFLPTRLFQSGYDVWLGNISGTRYSITHRDYDSIDDDKDFFDYDIEKLARNDVPAMVELIMDTQAEYKANGGRTCKKITMIGHSAGAGQILAALSYTQNSDRYISQVVGIEPCLIPDPTEMGFPDLDRTMFAKVSIGLDLLGIYSLFGPNWDSQVNLACQIQGEDDEICIGLRTADVAGPDLLNSENPWAQGETGVLHAKNMAQNHIYNNFAEYEKKWPFGDWNGTNFRVQDISSKIPVHAIWSNGDQLCPRSKQIRWWGDINTLGEQEYLDGIHGDQVGRQDNAYMNLLKGIIEQDGLENKSVISGNCETWRWWP